MNSMFGRRARSLGAALLVSGLLGALAPVAVAAEGEDERPVKEIKMFAENWDWSPDTIRVERGTLVKITVENVDATHRFDLKEFKLKVVLRQDSTTTFEFVADKVGEFRWRCGRPCGDGCAKMNGKLIVAEPGDDEDED